jgi:hypothetical protein
MAGTSVKGATCEAIQNAIDALPSAGGEVLLKPKKYVCRGSIVIDRDNVTLRGSGRGTVLWLADHTNRPVLVLGQTISAPNVARSGIEVADLSIDGNRAQQDFECSRGPCSGEDFLRNNGISLRRVEDVMIEHVTVENARSGGLVAELGSRRLTVRDFTSFANEFDGLAAYETQDSRFIGLYLHDNEAAGDFRRPRVRRKRSKRCPYRGEWQGRHFHGGLPGQSPVGSSNPRQRAEGPRRARDLRGRTRGWGGASDGK